MTRKEEIVKRVSQLEKQIAVNYAEMDALKEELSSTPDALLNRDTDADALASIERKNASLRKMGLLPESKA